MTAWLRLRQICLVTGDLEREALLVKEILGLRECYRDPHVAAYGLHNVLFPLGTEFLEIVSPTRPGTAAGRFLERHGGRDGYMVILDCDDPLSWRDHAATLGIGVANEIRHGDYVGVQLHPRDTGAAMVEFNHTRGGEDLSGPYAPAGPDWRGARRDASAASLIEAEIDCPDPGAFAARWSALMKRPARALADGGQRIALDHGALRFLRADVSQPVLAGIAMKVDEPAAIVERARARGRATGADTVELSGVRVRLDR